MVDNGANTSVAQDAAALAKLLKPGVNVVFFGGAGVSTESGIPDFRSEAGLYAAKSVYGYPPEELLSSWMLTEQPKLFWQYVKDNLIHTDAKPNAAHLALADLEKRGIVTAVITQNIDDLHQEAGSHKVLELHGSLARNYCVKCGARYPLTYVLDEKNCPDGIVPICAKPITDPSSSNAQLSQDKGKRKCGGMVRPDVVLYGEPLDEQVMRAAAIAIAHADVLIVAGTSLAVYPAAGLVQYFGGDSLVLINKTATPLDNHADLVIHQPVGEVLELATQSA